MRLFIGNEVVHIAYAKGSEDVAATITLMLIVVLVVCGFLANIYLFSRGAFTLRRFARSERLDDALFQHNFLQEEQYYAAIGNTEYSTERLLRRILACMLCAALVGAAILMLFIQSLGN